MKVDIQSEERNIFAELSARSFFELSDALNTWRGIIESSMKADIPNEERNILARA